MNFKVTKEMVREILHHAQRYPWTYQGFGMLRLYLGKVARIHIWDPRTAVRRVSNIHTHFWDLRSTVVCGRMDNVRYQIAPNRGGSISFSSHMMQTLITGEGGGLIGTPEKCNLQIRAVDKIHEGGSYFQRNDEIHQSLPIAGTVTILEREEGSGQKVAQTFWPIGWDWVSAEPRPATDQEVAAAANLALSKF